MATPGNGNRSDRRRQANANAIANAFESGGFQERQVNILDTLEKSFQSSLVTSQKIETGMDKITNILDQILQKELPQVISGSREVIDNIDEASRALERDAQQREANEKEAHGLRMDLLRRFGREVLQVLHQMSTIADNYTQVSNSLISVTGARGSQVRGTRSEIVHDIVSQLNSETGFYFNGEEAYKTMTSIADSANIGNLEAIKELTRPLLLAQESMNVNTTNLATMLNRWYNRYSFNSMDMEAMVDDIRGYTANNNSTAEASLRNMEKLQNLVEYYSGGDVEKLKSMQSSISKATSWLESMGIDSGDYAADVYKILSGEAYQDKRLIQILSAAGLSVNSARSMATSDQISSVFEALLNGRNSIMGDIDSRDVRLIQQTLSARGFDDLEGMLNAYNATNSDVYTSLANFEESVADNADTTELIDDKFVFLNQTVNNILSQFSEYIAWVQEHLPFSLGEIGRGILSIGSTLLVLSRINRLGSGTGSNLGSLALSGQLSRFGATGSALGLSGNAATIAGGAITGGGVLAGAGLTIDGIAGLISSESDKVSKGASLLELGGGAVGTGALIALGASNPVGWAALAVGGLSFLFKKVYEANKDIGGNASLVSDQFKDINANLRLALSEQEYSLIDIKQALQDEEDVEKARKALIESGILSEEDRNEAITANKDQLLLLTDAYLKATQKMTPEVESTLDQFELENKQYAKQTQEGINEWLYNNSADRLRYKYGFDDEAAEASSELAAANEIFKSMYTGLSKQDYSSFDKDTKAIYDKLEKIYLDGDYKLNLSELDDLLWTKSSFWSLTPSLQKGKFGTELMVNALNHAIAKSNGDTADELSGLKPEGTWHTDEAIQEYIEEATKLDSRANGANYIPYDGYKAELHEGEAIVPKVYNPEYNRNELEMLRAYYKDNTAKVDNEMLDTFKEFSGIVSEIKEFLEDWKKDNIRRSQITNSRTAHNSRTVSGYYV